MPTPFSGGRAEAPGPPANHAYLDPAGMFTAPGRPASAADLAKLIAAAHP